ncbi:CapA family protein [Aquiflexum sp.]|uniref:CapA family protein n=1 Tax=Aquiflexum sp. TaxID=1872584 RepID=UPI0035948758
MGDNNIQNREKPEEAYQFLLTTLRKADFIFMNLEGPFAKGWNPDGGPDIPHKNWSHSSADQVKAISAAGIDAVGVANNVTYPWQAFVRSKEVLDSVGVPFTGGGMNLESARKPVILEKAGLKVGFIQYAATIFPVNHAATLDQPGINGIKIHTAYQPPLQLDKPGQPPIVKTWVDEKELELLKENIRIMKSQVDIVVASCHWGVSDTYDPIEYQYELAHAMVDAGADVVFGHGPHRYQEVEVYHGTPIFYSLGQGVFDDKWNDRYLRYKEGLMVKLAIQNKNIKGASLLPLWREDDNFLRIYDPSSGKGEELYKYLLKVCRDKSIIEVKNKEIVVKLLN